MSAAEQSWAGLSSAEAAGTETVKTDTSVMQSSADSFIASPFIFGQAPSRGVREGLAAVSCLRVYRGQLVQIQSSPELPRAYFPHQQTRPSRSWELCQSFVPLAFASRATLRNDVSRWPSTGFRRRI